jgi:IclR family acetate operon transcriptional repressor
MQTILAMMAFSFYDLGFPTLYCVPHSGIHIMSKTNGDGTASLDKALDILDAVAATPEGLSQAQLGERTALPRTTLYRLLSALVGRGMLRRDPQRRVYCLGMRCFEMAQGAYRAPDLTGAASIELRNLRDLTGETSYLAVQDGLEVLSLERCDGAHSKRSAAALGQRKPMHCTSQGKAILSVLDEKAREDIIRQITLRPLTPLTITDRRRLQAELRLCAARGYAIDDEEIVLGVRCVGAPIVDREGSVRGAISVAGPAFRLSRERLELLGPELAEAARRIGAQLDIARHPPGGDTAQPLPGPWAFHGAFPRWSDTRRALYWADTLAPTLRCRDDKGERELAALDGPIHCLVLHEEALLAGCTDGVWRIEPDSGMSQRHAWPGRAPLTLCSDHHGGLWACVAIGVTNWAIGRWSLDSGIDAVWHVDEPIYALAWDPADGLLYGIASESGTILRMRETETVLRRFAVVSRGSGILSGITIDGNGGVWVALSDGWNVMRYLPDGNLDRVIGLPVPQPTDLQYVAGTEPALFITSARQALSIDALENAPFSGQLFRYALTDPAFEGDEQGGHNQGMKRA